MSGIFHHLLAFISAATDPFWKYVVLLLHGDGTNGAQNNTFIDSSSNALTVTRNGSATQGSFSPFGPDWSNYFSGSGSNLLLPFSSAFNLTADFTIEIWVYMVSNTGGMILNCGGGLSIAYASYEFNFDGTYVNFAASSTNSNYDIGSETGTTGRIGALPFNTWCHIAVTRSGNVYRGFINGVQGYTQTLSLAPYSQTTRGLSIAGNYANTWGTGTPTSSVNAYVSNLRIVKGTAVYTAAFTPLTAPLTAITNTSLLTCQSNRFIDNSTNAFAITIAGSPSIQRFSPFSMGSAYSTSVIGGSGLFGTADYLSLPTTSAFQFGANNFTIECWVYLNSAVTTANRIIFINYSPTFTTNSIYFGGHSSYSGQVTFWAYNINSGAPVLIDPTTLIPYTWTHIAVVRNGTNFTLYRDGIAVNTATSSVNIVNSTTGGYVGSGSTSVDGYLSNFRMVNGTAVYTAAFTPPTAPLTAITNTSLLLNTINSGIYDNAMMNNLITAGNAQISTSQSKFGGASMYFNGSGYLKTIDQPILNMGNGKWTIEMWIRPTGNYTFYNTILAKRTATIVNTTAYELFLNIGDGRLGYYNGTVYLSTTTPTANVWSYVAWVFDGTNINIYLNGTSILSTAVTNANVVCDLYIGCWSNGTPQDYYIGYIDDLRITKGYARYTANFTPPTAAFPNY